MLGGKAIGILLLLLGSAAHGANLRGTRRQEQEQEPQVAAVGAGEEDGDVIQVLHTVDDDEEDDRHRNMATATLGRRRTVLIVRIIAPNGSQPRVSSRTLYNAVFGNTNSLKHQLAKCSGGQMQIEPTAQGKSTMMTKYIQGISFVSHILCCCIIIGVMDVKMDRYGGSSNSRRDLMVAAEMASNKYVPSGRGRSIRQVADHIMFVFPQGFTSTVAYAELGVGAKLSLFNDNWALSLTTLMHEVR